MAENNTLSNTFTDLNKKLFGQPNTFKDYLKAGNNYSLEDIQKAQLAKTFGLLQEDKGIVGGFTNFLKNISTPLEFGFGVFNAINQWKMQNKTLDMMDTQLKIAKEQWDNTKQELNAIRKARSNIVKQLSK